MNKLDEEKIDLFETHLIGFLTALPEIENSLGNLAIALESTTGKSWNKKKLYYMVKGEGYAKQWQIIAMLEMALKNGWLPNEMKDWMHIIWTLTGKRQSAEGGNNDEIYLKLADMSGKAEFIFQQNYKLLMEKNYGS
jgi:hypothetical protein